MPGPSSSTIVMASVASPIVPETSGTRRDQHGPCNGDMSPWGPTRSDPFWTVTVTLDAPIVPMTSIVALITPGHIPAASDVASPALAGPALSACPRQRPVSMSQRVRSGPR